MSKKEDDLAIDFSGIGRKIGSLFKAGSKTESRVRKEKPSHNEPHAGPHETHAKKSDDEISLDLRKAGSFIVKHRTVFLLLIPLFIAIFFRAYPIYLPITDEWAKSSVDRYYKAQITDQINQQYPNLPAENKEVIANENLEKLITERKDVYRQQISQVSQTFKAQFQDETGQTYILDIDPWHWYRYTKNIVDHGYPGDYIREDGVMMDNHMVAPLGNKVGKELHPYFGAYLHMFLRLFNSNISVMTSFFMLPLVLSIIMVIPAFFIGRKIGGDLGGLFTSILLATNPSLLARTTAGVPDTDAYTILFPLIIVWLFYEALDSTERKNAIIYSVIAAFFVAVFSATWYGWWYIFDFLIGVTVIYLIYLVLVQKESLKDALDIQGKKNVIFLSLVCFFVCSMVLVPIFTTTSNFSSVFTQPISFISIKQSANPSLWPNVFTTVAELNEASLSQVIQSLGGKMLFAISLLGILLILVTKNEGKSNAKYATLLVIWFLATIYASTKGIRFVNLLVPAFSLAVGAAVGISFRYLSRWIVNELNVNKMICNFVLALLMIMILIVPIKTAQATAKGQVPLISDGWYNALTKIRTNSTQDAIVNSWWDFGHWFKAVTDRAVTFDGASQNRPQAHWVGHVLLTDNEDQAIGILRMLDCGANTAFDVLNNQTNNMHLSIDIVYSVIVLDKEDARAVLEKNGIPEDKIEEVLKYTHCSPPEDYFITSEDMVGKAGVWAHFGSWDFEKAKIWTEFRKKSSEEAVALMMKEFNYSEEKAQNTYYEVQSITDEKEANNWISPWPGYAGVTSCQQIKSNNGSIQCVFNIGNQMAPFQVDIERMEASIETTTGQVRPSSMVYVDKNDNFVEKKYANNTLPYSLGIVKKGDGYQAIMMSPQLAASMFTRLFYFDGAGLKHFDKFDHEVDISGQNIIVWKVDWEGKK